MPKYCGVMYRSVALCGVTWRRNSSNKVGKNKHLQIRRAAENSISAAYGRRQDARGTALGSTWRRPGRTQVAGIPLGLHSNGSIRPCVTGQPGAVKISGSCRGLRPDGVPDANYRVLKSGVSQN